MDLRTPTALPTVGEAHLWRFNLADFSERMVVLSAGDREQAQRFTGGRRRKVFELARAGLRHILASYIGAEPQAIALRSDVVGRPVLEEPQGFELSLAHSGGIALFALARGRRIGVDLERMRAMPEAASLASDFLSPSSLARLAAEYAPQRDRIFLAYWTRIEAMGKADGRGVGEGLKLMKGAPAELMVPPSACKARAAKYYVQDLELGPGWLGAIAIEARGVRLRCFDVVEPRAVHQPYLECGCE